jgi:hypothetical protein
MVTFSIIILNFKVSQKIFWIFILFFVLFYSAIQNIQIQVHNVHKTITQMIIQTLPVLYQRTITANPSSKKTNNPKTHKPTPFNTSSTSTHSPGCLNTLSGTCPGICVRALYTRICSPYRFFSTSDTPVSGIGIGIDIRDAKLLADDLDTRDGAEEGEGVSRGPYPYPLLDVLLLLLLL